MIEILNAAIVGLMASLLIAFFKGFRLYGESYSESVKAIGNSYSRSIAALGERIIFPSSQGQPRP